MSHHGAKRARQWVHRNGHHPPPVAAPLPAATPVRAKTIILTEQDAEELLHYLRGLPIHQCHFVEGVAEWLRTKFQAAAEAQKEQTADEPPPL